MFLQPLHLLVPGCEQPGAEHGITGSCVTLRSEDELLAVVAVFLLLLLSSCLPSLGVVPVFRTRPSQDNLC